MRAVWIEIKLLNLFFAAGLSLSVRAVWIEIFDETAIKERIVDGHCP